MNTNFKVFQDESAEIIASFSEAIAKISRTGTPQSIAATRVLEASLANTLSSISASLASSVGITSNASLANSISSLAASLATLIGTTGIDKPREASLANAISSISASLSSSLKAVASTSFVNKIGILRNRLKSQVTKFVESNSKR